MSWFAFFCSNAWFFLLAWLLKLATTRCICRTFPNQKQYIRSQPMAVIPFGINLISLSGLSSLNFIAVNFIQTSHEYVLLERQMDKLKRFRTSAYCMRNLYVYDLGLQFIYLSLIHVKIL
ncbi:hypothetical protein BDF20DRAFT_837512 [Mycotypha africana]|uniref:uncharacterized protein n=1 Tax=Mycotypha africana TaxID=64632 RepID=UPI0023005539|nr:uncharacterized protein BDF20DRAFT_837512 [Mycotypha africana]KAI8973579.1 hypothetical protein BDF20DRAFT_837512 [Mycotypha africana]